MKQLWKESGEKEVKIKNDVNTYYLNYLSNKYCESGKAGSFLLKTNTLQKSFDLCCVLVNFIIGAYLSPSGMSLRPPCVSDSQQILASNFLLIFFTAYMPIIEVPSLNMPSQKNNMQRQLHQVVGNK